VTVVPEKVGLRETNTNHPRDGFPFARDNPLHDHLPARQPIWSFLVPGRLAPIYFLGECLAWTPSWTNQYFIHVSVPRVKVPPITCPNCLVVNKYSGVVQQGSKQRSDF
jgi:hypothetical protein